MTLLALKVKDFTSSGKYHSCILEKRAECSMCLILTGSCHSSLLLSAMQLKVRRALWVEQMQIVWKVSCQSANDHNGNFRRSYGSFFGPSEPIVARRIIADARAREEASKVAARQAKEISEARLILFDFIFSRLLVTVESFWRGDVE